MNSLFYEMWKGKVKRWAELNSLSMKEAEKFLNIILVYDEGSQEELGYRHLAWVGFDDYLKELAKELKND